MLLRCCAACPPSGSPRRATAHRSVRFVSMRVSAFCPPYDLARALVPNPVAVRLCALIAVQLGLLQEGVEQRSHLLVVHIGKRNMRAAFEAGVIAQHEDFGVPAVLVDELGAQARLLDPLIDTMRRIASVVAPHELDRRQLRQLLERLERNTDGAETAG